MRALRPAWARMTRARPRRCTIEPLSDAGPTSEGGKEGRRQGRTRARAAAVPLRFPPTRRRPCESSPLRTPAFPIRAQRARADNARAAASAQPCARDLIHPCLLLDIFPLSPSLQLRLPISRLPRAQTARRPRLASQTTAAPAQSAATITPRSPGSVSRPIWHLGHSEAPTPLLAARTSLRPGFCGPEHAHNVPVCSHPARAPRRNTDKPGRAVSEA
ncbi:hypothetical protein CERSUDRAFT_92612 [Gelatoporia subvermispora B]|uniref:Uncharacterized protein n=1 Tax=Ceriporiopsis subvermispora (strain B) TaxID=914234 RepID=M2QSV1_CERS8|nr:hypothetical protein CERSUDRAFT_92612 [Gelatoporia subvermispora B]